MPRESTVVVGHSLRRIDAEAKVTGAAPYPGDFDFPNQLYMKLRFSDRAHARIRAVDTSAALALPGVVAIFTSADIPVNEYGLVTKDQPVLCGVGNPHPGTDIVRCYMDQIAVVIAESEAIAADAAARIVVEYDDLPAVFDPETAMQPGAPRLHADYPDNIVARYRIRKGDPAAGFAAADVIIEGEFQTGYQEHAYLQPEAGVGFIDEEGRTTIVVAGQWTHEDHALICHALDLPADAVRVIYPAIGGAFGGREDMSIQIVLALAVNRLRRPIKTIWSREESIRYHHKRHPIGIRARWGATYDGRLTAVEARVVGDAGGYNYTSSKVLASTNLVVTGPYECDNIHIDTYAVYTNNIPTGAFRGFGSPQAAFAAEGMMNRLAERLGIDPITIRLRNVIREGSLYAVGTPMPRGVSMPLVIERLADESGWTPDATGGRQRPAIDPPRDASLRRGVGVACGFKNVGYAFGFPERSSATIELHGGARIERVVLRAGGADVGQGSHTVFVQMAAEAIGVSPDCIELITQDTARTDSAGSASASRMTFMAGNAIRGAAQEALAHWAAEERPAIATYHYDPPRTNDLDPQTGRGTPNFAYGYVAESVEVEVDIDTGLIRVLRVVCADDVGKAINPQLVRGQVEGAIVQALGYAVMERLVTREGRILNPQLSTYLIPTALDVPLEVKSVLVEHPDPLGPWGARGMAEMPLVPLTPAIAAAVHDATGVWINHQPLTPDVVVAALRAAGIGGIDAL